MPVTKLHDPFVPDPCIGHHHEIDHLVVRVNARVALHRGDDLLGLPEGLSQLIPQRVCAVDDDELLLDLGEVLNDPCKVDPISAADFDDHHLPNPR